MPDDVPIPPAQPGAAPPDEAGAGQAPTGSASLAAAMGGVRGVIEASIPPAVFVIAFLIADDGRLGAFIALGAGGLLALDRLRRRESLQHALTGLAGVGLAAFIVSRTGNPKDFFLPGLLFNLAYAAAYAISNLARWPLVGVLVALVTQSGMGWRQDRDRRRAYAKATWVWTGLFLVRLGVQLPLYLAGLTAVLGVARVAMGLPLFVVGIWLSWLLLRHLPEIGGRTASAQPTGLSHGGG